ncbi:uncharacterized protein A1O5_02199 [Cladophialophora psammophila CBS 110553]|uniref:Phenol 2-monooxygenase n=1 Tax=Cladophialophora psammophila CBS 110553 TaxID=1182543 RepID=W9X9C0_9EURO|nr:uncharacterized protein A1O5_02199 [Cladophialophora psammophila CBS 110553]EXJ73905.1 hypothetical protein A1O5_02199 [Cladophialophora psammophila CBS 110553]
MDHPTQLPTSEVDVVIVGAGPAGLMSNLWLSTFKGLSVRIIDKRTATVYAGQADGLVGRTQEVFNSFGFEERVLKIAQPMAEFSFWEPDRNGQIFRSSRTADGPPNMSRFQGAVLHQGYIERFLKDAIKEREGPDVEYGMQPDLLQVDESMVEGDDSHPITLRIRHLSEQESAPSQFGHTIANGLFRSTNFSTSEEEDQAINTIAKAGTQEIIKCKYLLGCDGAHSWIRRQIGVNMEGDQTDFIWGVLDIHPLTDFPDIRSRCSIHSARSGSLMVVPRENELVRLYIQLEDLERNMDGRIDRSKITPEDILRAAQKIITPYTLQYDYCDWFTAYQIGQRVSTRYTKFDRVFILGDACHTHSPKAGQGMNVSLMDAYNLGWKIAQVLQHKAPRSILATYEAERRPVAQELIEFDRKWSSLFSGKLEPNDNQAEDGLLEEFKQTFEDAKLFVAGITVTYAPSVLVDKTSHQKNDHSTKVLSKTDLAKGIHLGMRIPSYRVLNQADARSWHLQDRLPSNGQWRLLIFAGSMIDLAQRERVLAFADYLLSPLSILNTYASEDIPLFDIITVHSGPRTEVELSHFPPPLRKMSEYNNVFVDDHSYLEPFGDAYKNYGVDSIRGCVVLIRPDQYVSWIGDLEDTDKLETFCRGCLRRLPSSSSL